VDYYKQKHIQDAGRKMFEQMRVEHASGRLKIQKSAETEAAKNGEVFIRRQWNDFRVGSVTFSQVTGLHWSTYSGGVGASAPRPFIHGYIYCDEVKGEISHSCAHGEGPHKIKVCLVKKDNPEMWEQILRKAGPKPESKLRP
jgi:hypothetical protein